MATSRSLNRVMIIGNLSRDPVIKDTPGGASVCTFGVATNTAWKDESGELQERAEFHNIVAWNKLGEICAQILAVGMLVYLEGEMRTRSWTDESGIRHYKTEVRISDMKLLDNKGKSGVGIEEARIDRDEKSGDDNSDDKADSEEDKAEEVKENNEDDSDVDPEDLPF